MFETAEEIERKKTMKKVEDLVEDMVGFSEDSVAEFKEAVSKCDFYNSLRAYMNAEHFFQRAKNYLNDLYPMDPGRWDVLVRRVDELERNVRGMAEDASKKCKCEPTVTGG